MSGAVAPCVYLNKDIESINIDIESTDVALREAVSFLQSRRTLASGGRDNHEQCSLALGRRRWADAHHRDEQQREHGRAPSSRAQVGGKRVTQRVVGGECEEEDHERADRVGARPIEEEICGQVEQ